MPRRNKYPRHLTHARTRHFSLKQMTEEIDISYTLVTRTVPDDDVVIWPGPVTIADGAIVTIGDNAQVDIEDSLINIGAN